MMARLTPVCVLGAMLLLGGCGGKLEVEVALVEQATIEESFQEPARTRLEHTSLITMPVDGRIGRVALEPGDLVEEGAELVEVDLTPFLLDVQEAEAEVAQLQAEISVKENTDLEDTAREQLEATITASEAALHAATQQVEAQKRRSEYAEEELDHMAQAHRASAVSTRELDAARLAHDTAEIEYLRQEFDEKSFAALLTAIKLGPRFVDDWLGRKRLEKVVLVHQLAQADVRLQRAQYELGLARSLRSPIRGVVLERYEQGDRTLPVGGQLLLLGDREDLEVVAEVLTQDAQRLHVGTRVVLEPGRGLSAFEGLVTRIEPSAFTKLSSLGVEQQRVKVIVEFASPPPQEIGVGYRLQARFFTDRREGAVVVERFSVLEDPDGSLYVLRVRDGRLRRQTVGVGLTSDLQMEILEGLSPGDPIVRTPDTTLEEGQAVTLIE